MMNKTLSQTLESLAAGHALVAQKKLSAIGRCLMRVGETQGDSGQLVGAREELATAKEIVGMTDMAIGSKLDRLRKLKLFDGVKISPQFQTA